ncbi:MAG TPA: dicarboxylate/amino acid:cation symporter [Gammaproteobacteria bacterium]|nr:dicarboxylate/amino acid:cation symporter [Gammaproteobacteria bacterium]
MNLTIKILLAMLLGCVAGLLIRMNAGHAIIQVLLDDILKTGGNIFITILKMLVVPVVFVSLVCGSSSLDIKKLGRIGGKTLVLYLITTAIAITLAILFASIFSIGSDLQAASTTPLAIKEVPSIKDIISNLFPSNFFKALVEGEMLQIIVFSILFGMALSAAGEAGKRIGAIFRDLNDVIMHFITMMLQLAPYGIFCLVAVSFAQMGFNLIGQLFGYFSIVLLVLLIHLTVTYSLLLKVVGGLNPLMFFRKFYPCMLFAFSTSSSNASIPVVLETVEHKLGVKNQVASFIVPLGATINMDGTAIMQGVATVFIAHVYNVPIGLTGFLMVIMMATLASIGTAGIPSVGLITLAMVLKQVNVPVEGIALIIGVDRLLDMARTAVNVSGDAVVACIVAKNEKSMNTEVYDTV